MFGHFLKNLSLKSIKDYDFWMKSGRAEVDVVLERFRKLIGKGPDPDLQFLGSVPRPKNLVLFVGDGLGISTVTASRIYKGQSRFGVSGEETVLLWEDFPETALLKVCLFLFLGHRKPILEIVGISH